MINSRGAGFVCSKVVSKPYERHEPAYQPAFSPLDSMIWSSTLPYTFQKPSLVGWGSNRSFVAYASTPSTLSLITLGGHLEVACRKML